MGRKSRTAVLKRQREVRKAEKAAMKREKRANRDAAGPAGEVVATAEDLAAYGFGADDEADDSDSEAPPGAPPPPRLRPAPAPPAVRPPAVPRESRWRPVWPMSR